MVVELDLCPEPAAPLEFKEMVYRIVQEALRNIAKHAAASRVQLRMHTDGSWMDILVVDDGVGFDATAQFLGHYGLQSMAERAVRLGGTLTVESTPGQGTRVTARVPMDE